jgi:hypothetical protein
METEPMAASDSKHPTYAVEAIPSDIRDGQFLGNPALDNVVSCVIAMGAEMWSMRRRMKVLEAVMASKGITPEMIEKYVPTAQQAAEWEKDRDRFIDLTLGPMGDPSFRNASSDFVSDYQKR